MNRYIKIAIIILITLGLYTCARHHHTKATHSETTEVTAAPLKTTLYYSGVVQPLKTVIITSPADGVVREMSFHFGDEIKSGQLLFSISSEKFQADYKSALMQYIKVKTDYLNSQTQMKAGEFLYKNQLISEDDYKNKQTAYYNARLAMIQAKDSLDNMQKQIDLHNMNLSDLKIEDIDKITEVLHAQTALQNIHVNSAMPGVVLLPTKGDGAEGELKKVAQGDSVKQGEVLAMIGDISGLKIHINVNEFNVNQLKIGQKVQVTGAAFSDFTLQGEIAAINRQGESTQGGLPNFPVEIIVPKITAEQQAVIHMGMSAKVAIEVGGEDKITVPLKAILQKDGKTLVNVKDKKTGKIREVLVKTGATTLDSVVIESNLSSGENIVIPD